MLTAICYRKEAGWTIVQDLSRISELRVMPGSIVWAQSDAAALSRRDVGILAEEFDLHPLAVEDALNARQRPKLEQYENHLFTVMHQLDESAGQLEASQIACFIGRQWVLTLHHGAERTIEETMRRCRSGEPVQQGPSFVMHALLDAIVDDYQAIADRLEGEIESLEELVLQTPRVQVQHQLYSLKQQLSRLRRYAIPGERVLATLSDRDRYGLITERTAEHFRDVHDHTLRIIDQVRNVDDLVDAVIDLQRSEQANALNEVTKRLTGWAAIIAVPTFIASVYGMNFALVPKEGELSGFYFALGTMLASGLGLYTYFKRRNWI